MLIVEGPDGAGKTTLIKKLQEHWGLEVSPRVVSKDAEAMTDLKHWTEDNVMTAPHNLIFDRHRLISEPIYGSILRSEQQPGFGDVQWMTAMMGQFYASDPLIIYCLPPLEVVKANIEGDEDNTVVKNHIDAIYTAYTARAALDATLSPRSTVIYDYTQKPLNPLSPFQHWHGIISYRKTFL